MISYLNDCLHEYKAIRRQRKSFKVISKYIDSRENVTIYCQNFAKNSANYHSKGDAICKIQNKFLRPH